MRFLVTIVKKSIYPEIRTPAAKIGGDHLQQDDREDVGILENTLKVNYNSNAINPKKYTKSDVGETNIPFKSQIKLVEG